MNSILVSEVTDKLIKDFSLAYWAECGAMEEDFMIESYADDAVRIFRHGLNEKSRYIDGLRWDVMTYQYRCPTGIWPHVKVRFKVTDPMDGTPFESHPFQFVIYGNSIADKRVHERVSEAVEALAKKLSDRFPVVAER